MAGLWWMAVTLFLLVHNGDSLPVDQNELAGIVTELLNRYRPTYEVKDEDKGAVKTKNPMFSVAVSIPYNEATKKYDFSKVTDSGEAVRAAILKCKVYTGTRVVAATVLRLPNVFEQCPNEPVQWGDILDSCDQKPWTWNAFYNFLSNRVKTWSDFQKCFDAIYNGRADHAEWRTLQHFNTLTKNMNKKDLLLFYVLASPCGRRCTSESNDLNILKSINEILRWDNYAVVFSDVFMPRGGPPIPDKERSAAIERLGTYKGDRGPIGLTNIFRCDGKSGVECKSCSDNNQVARYCYDNKKEQGTGGGQSSSGGGGGRGGRGGGRGGRGGGRGGGTK